MVPLDADPATVLKREVAVTVSEASSIMRVSRNTIYRMVERGELKGVKVGRLLFIPTHEIERIFGLR